MNLATCIGCGCHDLKACCNEISGQPCHWLTVDRQGGLGVCSECPAHLSRWRAGDRSICLDEPDLVDGEPGGHALLSECVGIKIRCNTRRWSRQVQVLLERTIGCSWGNGKSAPWNTGRPFLIVQPRPRPQSSGGGWYFSWATPRDFEDCPLPEWTARALIASYPGNQPLAPLMHKTVQN